MPDPARAPGHDLRAALVLLHLVAIGLGAFPAPEGGMSRSAWEDPTVKGEFHRWGEALRGAGLAWSDAELMDRAWSFAGGFIEVRRVVLLPFQPYYRYFGAHQSWRMFVAPHRFPTRLHVDLHEGGAWRTLYVERDPDHDWHGRWLDHDRFRSEIFRFGWKSYAKSYGQFAVWLARLAAKEFPEGDALRVRLWRAETPTPEQVASHREPEGRFESQRVVRFRDLPPLPAP